MANLDPFIGVKEEVNKTIETTDKLFHRWCELREDPTNFSHEEYDWTANELRNCLRSIDWDLDDLEETISIVEKNQKKFKIDASELNVRRCFITQTRASVQGVRDHMSMPKNSKVKSADAYSNHPAVLQTTTTQSITDKPDIKNKNKYKRLENELDDATPISHRLQTARLHGVGSSTMLLPRGDVSSLPNSEQDEQTVMLGVNFNDPDSSLSNARVEGGVVNKVIRVLHIYWKIWTLVGVILFAVAMIITFLFLV